MPPLYLIFLLIGAIAVFIAVVIFYFTKGKKLRKQREDNETFMQEHKQTVDLYIVDKKNLSIAESGLPKAVLDTVSKRQMKKKMPIVKAKYGPNILTLVADRDVFKNLPVKSNVRGVVSGIYLTDFKPLKNARMAEVNEAKKKKKKK